MKVLKRIGITILILVLIALLGSSLYWAGEDVLRWIPVWLNKLALGVVTFSIIIIIVVPFIVGIFKIKDFFKED